MSSSGSSVLSSAPNSEDEAIIPTRGKDGILQFLIRARSNSITAEEERTPPRKREPSPPHEYVLADNPDIAFIVMFRSRFHDVFPKSLSHLGPQDIEEGVVSATPGEHVESLLCALVGLVLNRKKYVERGHHQRALEEAVLTHTPHWPRSWQGKNPMHGGNTFGNMTATDRLTLLKTLTLWALASSEAVQTLIKESYKQVRHEDDLNQPLSIQPWGQDGEKRRYWLIEGQDDTNFRLYRESNIKLKNKTWRSVAGDIEQLKLVGEHLHDEGSQPARRLSERISHAIPRFEATEEIRGQKRRRREYRVARKAQFRKPEPGFSMYEGRTRGKKMRYTFSSDEDADSESPSNRRSHRHSGVATPAESEGPTFTASGRQVRSRHGGRYGETMIIGRGGEPIGAAEHSGTMPREKDGTATETNGRPRRSTSRTTGSKGGDHIEGYNSVDEMDDEEEAASSGADDYGDDDDDEVVMDDEEPETDEDEEMSDEDDEAASHLPEKSLVVQLRYQKLEKAAPPSTSEDLAARQPELDLNPSLKPSLEARATNNQLTPADDTTAVSSPKMLSHSGSDVIPPQNGTTEPDDLKTSTTLPGLVVQI